MKKLVCREMRCMRHKIHIGLFLTYIFADLAWIITALLQVGACRCWLDLRRLASTNQSVAL
jgi:hypothetical protein